METKRKSMTVSTLKTVRNRLFKTEKFTLFSFRDNSNLLNTVLQLQNTLPLMCVSSNKNSNSCYKPCSSKYNDTNEVVMEWLGILQFLPGFYILSTTSEYFVRNFYSCIVYFGFAYSVSRRSLELFYQKPKKKN